MSKAVKQLELDDLRKTLSGIKDYVVLEPVKVDAATDVEFRKKLRLQKIRVKMVKNSYAQKVFGEMGISLGELGGPTLLCWGADSVKGLANAVDTAVKEAKKDPKSPEKFKVKTAVSEGQVVSLDLAKTLPTRMEAIGDLLGALLGPGAAIAGALTGPAAQIASILTTIEEKKEEVKTDVPEAPPAA